MTATATPVELPAAQVRVPEARLKAARFGFAAAAAAGLVGLVLVRLVYGDARQFWFSYLFGWYFAVTVGLGCLFWVLIHHLTEAGWSTVVRRTPEHFVLALPLLGALFVPVLLALPGVYAWADIAANGTLDPAEAALYAKKRAYLNQPFFWLRIVVYFAVWSYLALTFRRKSVEQDESGDWEPSRRMRQLSAPGVLLLGVTATFAAFDVVMSLDWVWFSTMFGVYTWAGCIRASLAAVTLTLILLRACGYLTDVVTVEHLHDLGKLLFGFTVFWAYIAFSQYFLYWYGNLPEETRWFLRRQNGDWMMMTYALPVCHFIVPFCYLMPQAVKRNPLLLGVGAAWVLSFHGVDVYWQIMPTFYDAGVYDRTTADGVAAFDARGLLADASALLLFVGVLGSAVAYGMGKAALVPLKDPRLAESLTFENNE